MSGVRVMAKIGSLCTGYGGLDLAAESYFNAQTVWTADIDKYASIVIAERFNVPNHGDLTQIDWSTVEPIDILTAGYPCQPFSHAGERKGTNDKRHIWPHIKQAISELRPSIVILENVRGHLTLGFDRVLGDLTEIGYDAKWSLISAADVGAPHKRERLFVVAYPNSNACEESRRANRGIPSETGEIINGSNWHVNRGSSTPSDTNDQHKSHDGQVQELGRRFVARCEMYLQAAPNALVEGKLNSKFVEYMMGLPVGWVTDIGLSNAQTLKMLGNGVVPQQAEYALEILWDKSHNIVSQIVR
jgi:DNA (cytosine-5)-methyltransferase 1